MNTRLNGYSFPSLVKIKVKYQDHSFRKNRHCRGISVSKTQVVMLLEYGIVWYRFKLIFVIFRESQNELDSLTNLIESMWTHYEPAVSPNNLNLDQIFSFLQEEKALDAKAGKHSNKTLDEITDELNELNDLLSEDMVMYFLYKINFASSFLPIALPFLTMELFLCFERRAYGCRFVSVHPFVRRHLSTATGPNWIKLYI